MRLIKGKENQIKNLAAAAQTKHLLALILALAAAVRFLTFTGMYRFDSYFYAQLSYFVSRLDFQSFFFENNNFFAIGRLLLYLPTAFFYRFFDVNDFTSVAFVFIASLLTIAVIFFLGKKLFDEKVGLVAAFLLSIYPLDVYYSTQYLPDGLLPLFFSLSALAFLYGEDEGSYKKRVLFYYLSGVFIGIAQYVRENAFIFVTVLFVYVVFKRRFRMDYFWVIVGGLTVFVLASLFFFFGTGNLLFQIDQVLLQFSSTKERMASSTDRVIDWFRFTKLLLGGDLFRSFSLLFFVSIVFSIFNGTKKMAFVLIWFFTLLIYLEVISQFHGLAKHDRYLSVISIPIILVISSFIINLVKRYKTKLHLCILILVLLIIPSLSVTKSMRLKTISHVHFVTNRAFANSLADRPASRIYIQNLQHKGYVYNYVLGFDRLNYNSFQRNRVEGTDSLLKDWDGKETPEVGSYVLIDSNELKKKVDPSWELIEKESERYLYYIPEIDDQ
jgi:4-amino-4-deoxy-L-arabinose transferase-like glycosyltransferase